MAKSSGKRSRPKKKTPFDDDKPALHPAVRRVLVVLDNMGITGMANAKPDGTTTITFHVNNAETFDDFLVSEPATRQKQ